MGVDESRGDDKAFCIKDLLFRLRVQVSDFEDARSDQTNVGLEPGLAGAIDDRSSLNEQAGGGEESECDDHLLSLARE